MSNSIVFDVSYIKYIPYRGVGSGGGGGSEYEMKSTFEYNNSSQYIFNTTKAKMMASIRQYFTYYIFS